MRLMRAANFMIGMLATVLAGLALAEGPAALPTSIPSTSASATTAPYVPHVAVVPPGLHILKAGDYAIFCAPEDDGWAKDAVANVQPASRPSTMPSDLVASVTAHRDELLTQAVADLGMRDSKELANTLDKKLLPAMTALQDLKVRIYFLPVTHKKLTALMQAGWSDPRYYYNRYASEAEYHPFVSLSVEHPVDDQVMWVEIHDDDTPDMRRDALRKTIEDFNQSFADSISTLGQSGLRNGFAEFILNHVIDPLKLPPALQWFGRGIAGVYAIKYGCLISGASRSALTMDFMTDDPRNPIHSQPIDLLHPLDPQGMRPEYKFLYDEAVVRKGTSVIYAWVIKGGDGVVAKTLPKLGKNPPADTPALAKTVKEATGIDLTPVLAPNYKVVLEQRH